MATVTLTLPSDGQADWDVPLNAALTALQNESNAKDTVIAGKAPTVHTHAQTDVTGLGTALAGKAASVHSHVVGDVSGMQAALDAKAPTSHAHLTSDVTGLDTALSGKAASVHSHAQADVTGLVTALSGKAASSHSHDAGDIATGVLAPARLGSGTPDATKVLKGDGSWSVASGGGAGEPVGTAAGFITPRASARVLVSPGNTVIRTADPHFVTFSIESAVRLRSVSFQITAAGEAGNLIKLWLYRTGTHGSVPDTLHYDFGSVAGDATSNGMQIIPASPVALAAGWYAFIIGDTATTTHAGVQGNNTAQGEPFPGRTAPHIARLDMWTRGASAAYQLTMAGAPPATVDWVNSASATLPNVNNVSGGRNPLFLLDLIPAA